MNEITVPVRLREELFEALGPRLVPHGLSRRRFVELTGKGALAAFLTACTVRECTPFWEVVQEILERIANRPVRRDVNSLPAGSQVVSAYETAVAQMKARDANPGDPRSWTNWAAIHRNNCPHGNWLFLPWHRAYVYRFEEICRALSGYQEFALPYWNWQKDLKVPAVFRNESSPLFDPTRPADNGQQLTTTTAAIMEGILDEPNFLDFGSGRIELADHQRTSAGHGPLEGGPHGQVHGFVGGNMRSIPTSPLDPVFWMHHNMIECVWFEWNMRRGNPNTNDPAWTQRRFTEFFDRNGSPVSFTVDEMILYPLFFYRYDDPLLGTGS